MSYPGDQPPMTAEPVIAVDRLVRTFTIGRRSKRKTVEAVRNLSFTVTRGERLAFIGPNGAGKSTSIKMLTGILFPTSGDAHVLGLVPWQDRKALAVRIGTLFGQRSQLWPELTPRTSLAVLGAIFGMTDAQTEHRLAELGELLEADDLYDQPIRTQSLGQRMRCELTACMLHGPELLFLDEPTIGLDLLGKQLFRDLLVRVNEEIGTTVFLTSHDVADIERVAKRAIVVNHGTVIYDDTVEAMRGELLATKRIQVGLEPSMDAQAARAAWQGSTVAELSGVTLQGDDRDGSASGDTGPSGAVGDHTVVIEVDTAQVPVRQVLDRLLAELPVIDLSIADPPLENVIGEIYQRPLA